MKTLATERIYIQYVGAAFQLSSYVVPHTNVKRTV